MKILLILLLLPLLSIPIAFAETIETTGQNFDTSLDTETGETTWISHPERIMFNGNWENYHIYETDNQVIFNSNSVGTLIYDIPTCSYSVYDTGYNYDINEGDAILSSVSWIPRIADKDSDNWETLSILDDLSCEINITESEKGIHLLSTKLIIDDVVMPKKIDSVWVEQPSMFINGTSNVIPDQVVLRMVQDLNIDIYEGIKETVSISNRNPEYKDDYKFGLIQTLHMEDDTITINDEVLDISSVSGMQFDREWVIENEAYILQVADGIHYDIDDGINQLNSITILEENGVNKIALDYSYASGVTTLFNSFLVDPNITIAGSVVGSNITFNLSALAGYVINSGTYAGSAISGSDITAIQSSINAGTNTWTTTLQSGAGIIYTNDYNVATGTFTDTYNNPACVPPHGTGSLTNGCGSPWSSYSAGGPSPTYAYKLLSGHPAHNVAIDKIYFNFWSDSQQSSGPPISGTANVYFHGSNYDVSKPTAVQYSNSVSAKNVAHGTTLTIPNGGVSATQPTGGTYGSVGGSPSTAQLDPATVVYTFSPAITFLDSGTTSGDRTHIVVEAQGMTSYYQSVGWQALRTSMDSDLYNGNDIYGNCNTHWHATASLGFFNTGPYGSCRNMLPDSGNGNYGAMTGEKNPRIAFEGTVTHTNLELTYTVPTVATAPQSLNIDTQDVANEITINWSAPSSDGNSAITGYKIFIGGSQVATVGNVLTYDDPISGGEIDATLAYTVKAVNSVGDSVASNSVSITSWGVPAQVGTVTGTIGANPALSWSAPSSEATITNYKIYRAGSLHDTISSSATTYSDSTSVVAGTTYAYTVSAVSGVGEGAQSASVNVLAGTPPNAVSGVTASIPNTATAPLDVTVSFSPSGTTGTGTVTGFQLLRDGVAVSTAGLVTSMANTVPAGGTAYSFTVITLGTHGNSVASSASAVTTPNTPAQVTGLTVTPVSTSRIDLSWNTPNANNSLISGYKVQISSNGGSSYSDVLTGNVNTTYQALSLNGNAQYHFKVSAINGVGTGTVSAVSNTYTMTTTPASLSATPVSEVQINLSWGASTGATGYKVEYESPTGNGFTTHTANTGNTDLTKSITGLTTATQYNFKVSGLNAGGASVASPEASSYTWGILSAPTLDTITRLTSTSLKLDFTAGGGLPVATGYKIERQTGSGWIELIADTASTSLTFTDTVLSSDQTATYRLYAINNIGTSPVSNERTSDVIVSSGGGGGSSNKAVSSQTGITGLIDLTFIDQIHRVILGEFLSKSINVAWDSSDSIEVKSIIVSDSPFRIVFQDVPFVLIGDPSGISNGKINYSVQIPNDLCTTQGQINCVEQRQYDIPVEIQAVHKSSTLTKSSVIKIDLAGGSDIPLVFVLIAIGAVPLAFIIRKIGSGKSKRKASGSSHKSSKNGSNTKKMSM